VAASAYRSADQDLGRSLHVHRSSTKGKVRGVLILVGISVIGLASFLAAFDSWNDDAEGAVKSLLVMVASSVAIGCAAWGLVTAVRSRETRVDVCEHGVVLHADRKETAILWGNMREVLLDGRGDREGVSALTVVAADGTRLTVGDEIAKFDDLRAAIEQETTSRLFDEALARLEDDRAVGFGPFELTKEGLRHAEQQLPWRDVERGALTRGVLAVGSRANQLRVLPKRDGVLAWASAPCGTVPNPAVFLSLLSHLRGASKDDTGSRSMAQIESASPGDASRAG